MMKSLRRTGTSTAAARPAPRAAVHAARRSPAARAACARARPPRAAPRSRSSPSGSHSRDVLSQESVRRADEGVKLAAGGAGGDGRPRPVDAFGDARRGLGDVEGRAGVQQDDVQARPFDAVEDLAHVVCILGGVAAENADYVREVLDGVEGPRLDIVLLNAAAAPAL